MKRSPPFQRLMLVLLLISGSARDCICLGWMAHA
jgi:hypothetical protein